MEVTINYDGRTITFSSELKSKEYYEKNKKKFNDDCNEQYGKINGRPFIGSNSWLFKELKPMNYQDFFDKYLNYTDGKPLNPNVDYKYSSDLKKKENCGRTLEDLIAVARYYKKISPHVNYPLEEFFDDLVNHIILETYDGHQAELFLRDYCISGNCEVTETDGDFDANFGVDLIVKKPDNTVNYIQVKPLSTFVGRPKNPKLIKDRINFFKKQKDLDNYLGEHHEIIYMIYDKNHWDKYKEIRWWGKGNKTSFKLNELIDEQGNSLNNPWDFTPYTLNIKK